MRKIVVFFVVVFFVMMIGDAHAAWFGKQKKAEPAAPAVKEEAAQAQEITPPAAAVPAVAPEVKKEDKAREQVLSAKRALLERKRAELNNTEWQIEISEVGGKEKKETTNLFFKNNQVSCETHLKQGFPATNFTLSIEESGVLVWETMQTSQEGGVLFWRGEIDSTFKVNKGVISYHPDNVTSEDYSFVSLSRRGITTKEK